MKIRNGFVSNSSSSSFCIYGTEIEANELIKLLNLKLEEGLEDKLKEMEIEYFYGDPNYDNYIYIGTELTSMEEDETMRQFKARVKQMVDKISPDLKLGFIEQSWYDG